MGKVVVTLAVAMLIWLLWKKKTPAMATTPIERIFRALGAATRAMSDSARARAQADAPAASEPEPAPPAAAPITLVRCPKCGGYLPSDQACNCR